MGRLSTRFASPLGAYNVDLPSLIGGDSGYNVPTPWVSWPQNNILRVNLLAAATTSNNTLTIGNTVQRLGSLTDVYNVVNGLDANIYNFPATVLNKLRLSSIDTALFVIYPVIPSALAEFQAAGLPQPHLDLLYRCAGSDSPIYRVSTVATMIVLAACYQLHPRVT